MGTKEAVSKTTISIFEGLCLPLFCFDNFQHEQKTCFTLWNNMRSLLSWWKQGMRQSTEKEMSNIPEELYKVYFHCKMTNSWDDLHCWKIDSVALSKITPYCQQTCSCSSWKQVRGFAGKLCAFVGASLFSHKRCTLLILYLT